MDAGHLGYPVALMLDLSEAGIIQLAQCVNTESSLIAKGMEDQATALKAGEAASLGATVDW